VHTFAGPQQTRVDSRRPPASEDPGTQHRLQVFISEGKIETVAFMSRSDLSSISRAFLKANGLKLALQAGLQAKMESMVKHQETDAYVDLVDLV